MLGLERKKSVQRVDRKRRMCDKGGEIALELCYLIYYWQW
jgi:hypothetical protein